MSEGQRSEIQTGGESQERGEAGRYVAFCTAAAVAAGKAAGRGADRCVCVLHVLKATVAKYCKIHR